MPTFSYPTKRETTGEEVNFKKANHYPDTNLPEYHVPIQSTGITAVNNAG